MQAPEQAQAQKRRWIEGEAMTDKMKPCPFCGGEVERDNPMIDYASGHGFHCPTCNAYFQLGDDDMEADERWNTRYKRTCEIGDGLDCSNCGAIFDIGPCDKPRFCMYCGAEVADAD